jgi:hypothetical protein
MRVKGDLFVSGDLRGINFTDGVTNFSKQPKLSFNQGGFYLTATSDGSPLVNARGIVFTDGVSNYVNPTKVGFSSNFYLSGNTNASTTINLRNPSIKAISLEFPGAAENILVFRAHEAMRLLGVRAVLVGSASPSVTFSIKSGSDRSSLTTTHTTSTAVTNTTTGTQLAVSTPTIPAGSWVCLVSTAQSGTVTELDASLQVEWV